jgi:DNA-binding PadR family transcriptional regulator
MASENEDKTTANWMKEAQKGYIRMGVLILLNKKPSHGYEIMKEINSRTKGFWQPTAGGVYPILRDLEKSGYIKGHWETQKNRRLKVYKITQSGEAILRHAIVKQTEIFNNIGILFREFSRDVLNVEATDGSMPTIPSPFTPFLEEEGEADQSIIKLEHQRKHMRETVRGMQERLKLLDKRITDLKKGAKPASASKTPVQ